MLNCIMSILLIEMFYILCFYKVEVPSVIVMKMTVLSFIELKYGGG